MKSYCRSEAVSYAKKWFDKRNPEYPYACGESGDSTNFASQCLFAGSSVDDANWHGRGHAFTLSWTEPLALREFLLKPKEKGPVAAEVYSWALEPGDLVQVRSPEGYWRTLIVTANRAGVVEVASHSYQADSRLLDSYVGEIRCYHILGILTD